MRTTVATAATLGRCPVDRDRSRYSGANTIASTVAQRIAPLNGQSIHANAMDTATSSNKKLFSSRSRITESAYLDSAPSFRIDDQRACVRFNDKAVHSARKVGIPASRAA